VLFAVAVVAAIFPRPIVAVFLSPGSENAAAIVEYGATYVRIRAIEFVFVGVVQVLLGAFRGAGNTKTAMVISMVTLWVGRVLTVYLFAFALDWGATGIWVGMAFGNVTGAIVAAAWFTRGTWKRTLVDDAEDPA